MKVVRELPGVGRGVSWSPEREFFLASWQGAASELLAAASQVFPGGSEVSELKPLVQVAAVDLREAIVGC